MTPVHRRFLPLYAYAGVLVALSMITRLALLGRGDTALPPSAWEIARIFGVGLLYDFAFAAYFCLPFALYLTFLPERVARTGWHKALLLTIFTAFVYLLVVVAVAEWVFWDEFAARFNFIAVDYLVYTHEVLGNIWESYPIAWWLSLLAIPSLAVVALLQRPIRAALDHPSPWRLRLSAVAPWLMAPVAALFFVSTDMHQGSGSDVADELSGNGPYEFFAAFKNNELSYSRFYATLPNDKALQVAREVVDGDNPYWIQPERGGMHRVVYNPGEDKRLNVVLVSIESMGAEFLGDFGNTEGITPNFDALSKESLSFTQLYATGNRTVRGMEALALSLPPTPGQSIVKRPRNEQLFSLGSVFQDRGFDTVFMYGGYGYFDNLNYFFGNNDYRVIDRTALSKDEIHYENIWGVADEDLFTLALREMDASRAKNPGRPFFMHVLTTSNHRPYTYPPGRIDIPSGTGRSGAVKYTDYAVGDFLRRAKTHPWFKDTVFLITADHGASARGTSQIPVVRYRIPLMVYSPGHIKPGRFDRLMSQIDIGPTLLGLLGMGYSSKFYGHDVFAVPPSDDRALIGNYQTLGYMKDGRVVTLMPGRKVSIAPLPSELGLPKPSGVSDERLRDEAIALYQSASALYNSGLLKDEEANRAQPQRPIHASWRPRGGAIIHGESPR
jgi:phosphoglycerol transferase MdoB-like AlkP superfamily enzyme